MNTARGTNDEDSETDRCQSPSNGASLLGPKVKRQVFLFLVEFTETCPPLLVHHSENPGDGFADGVAEGGLST